MEKSLKILLFEPTITVTYSFAFQGLYVDWTGDQTQESVMHGCEQILHYLKAEQCRKVLNDNTNVTSIWSDASKWVATDWFPRMHDAGLEFFAWVYSPNVYSKLSTDETLRYSPRSLIITFHSIQTAQEWLKAV